MHNCQTDPCAACPNNLEATLAGKIDKAMEGRDGSHLPVVYISGPMSGIEDSNFPKFNEYARFLRFFGFPVLNPADFGDDPNLSWEECIARDIGVIPYADVILLLDGWENSKGAGVEFDLAVALGKPAVTEDCFRERVVTRFFSESEIDALQSLDAFRENHIVARFANGKTKIVTRDEGDKLRVLNELVALRDGDGGFLRTLLDDAEGDDAEGDDDAEG